jgi:hypothetical protein
VKARRAVTLAVLGAALAAAWWMRGLPAGGRSVDRVRVPPGFSVTVFADSLPNARSLALGARGTVFVGVRDGEAVYALVDADGDGRAESTYRLAGGFDAQTAWRSATARYTSPTSAISGGSTRSRTASPTPVGRSG